MPQTTLPRLALRSAHTNHARSKTWLSRPAFGPLLLALGIGIVLLGTIYRMPFHRIEDVGAWAGFGNGLHAVETAGEVSYVHTRGDARVQLPETGTGSFAVSTRLGGPGGTAVTRAHLWAGKNALDLGNVAGIRVYHLLAPANSRGDIGIRIQSPTLELADDRRQLGVLIDWIGLRSLRAGAPPALLLGSMLLCLTVFAFAFTRLGMGIRWRLGLLILIATVLNLAPLITRGQVALVPYVLGFGLSAFVALGLTASEQVMPLASLPGVAATFVIWKSLLWLVGGVGLWWSEIVYRHGRGIAYNLERTSFEHQDLLWRTLASAWMQWDSKHYQTIATTGYTFAGEIWPNIAFFPLYPLLIRVFMPLVFGSATIAALLIANLALFVAVLLLFDLVASDFDHITAYRSVLMLLLFPTSFYLVAGYTESLALALAVAAVWAMRREHWWLAGAAGFFLALTRVPGIMIAPVLTCAYLQHHSWNWRALLRPPFLAVLLPPLGLASFMLYQWLSFDTPVAFLVAQQNWNNGMAPPWVIPEKILRAIRTSSEWEMAVVQLVVWLSVIGLTIMAIRRLPLSYGLTTLLLLLPPFLANQRGSLIRHVLIGFPIFVVLALIARRQWQRWLVFSLTLPLLVLLTLLFVNGFGLA